jgi:hypothetical protein
MKLLNKMKNNYNTLILDTKIELQIIDRSLTHIKKVELNPHIVTDGDNFDYWNSAQLDNGNFVDYNVSMMDDEEDDPSKWSWNCEAFAVDPPEEEGGYHKINTNCSKYLFNYINGAVKYDL